MIGFLAALAGAGWWAAVAAFLSVLAIYLKISRWAAMPLAGASLLWLDAANPELSWVIVISGAIALGGITAEMLLGHWLIHR
jgi:hypothetical protein